MAMEDDILICKPTSQPGYLTPGSLPSRCSRCGQRVWLAPSSMILLHDKPEMKVVCLPCGLELMKVYPGTIERLTPAQLEEIEEARQGEVA